MTDAPAPVLARAKINLCLHVTGQRPDGYHMLDSLVAFAGVGDAVRAEPARRTSLTLGGPFAIGLPSDGDNLVLRAAALFPGHPVALHLQKNLPLASGIGGGSADAAATLSAIANLYELPLPRPEAVLALGADVPVCLHGRPVRMRGVGEVLDPLPDLPGVWAVLVNPGVSCPTPAVFAALEEKHNPALAPLPDRFASASDLFAWLATTRNDLESPAIGILPVIGRALTAMRATQGCALARMSGSGATVFGLFAQQAQALAAAEALRRDAPKWWCVACPLG